MLIAGSGGFAIQLFDILTQLNIHKKLLYFEESLGSPSKLFLNKYTIINSQEAAKKYFTNEDMHFALGTGNPHLRKKFYDTFSDLGGVAKTIVSPHAILGLTIVPPNPQPFIEIKISVPVAVNENHTSLLALEVLQHVALARVLAVAPSFV